MAKKSKQRSARQKKDQLGCMWGLINMFDFRHGRPTRRLLSDRRRNMNDDTLGSPYPSPEAFLPTSSQEMHSSIEDGENIKRPSLDITRTRVKELIEEEMFVDQDLNSITKRHEQINISKTLQESFDQEISISRQVSAEKASQYHDLEDLVKEILLIYHKKNEKGAKRSSPIVEEKLIAAVEVLLNEKSTNGDHNKIPHSKEMFQMLSSNKELFLKLVHDQKSTFQNEEQKSQSTTDQEQEEPVTRKHRKFFRRRSKSQDIISPNGKDRIVILKPGSSENQETNTEGNGSQFSFMEIRRRLKHAMGKDQQAPEPTERTGKTVTDGGWSSPNRDHFYTERFARINSTGDRSLKLRESETKNENADNQISNIYVEAKKHLSEMLTSGDEDAESMMRSLPNHKSLGRFLSLREYNSHSPGTSPRRPTRLLVNKSQPFSTIDNPLSPGISPRAQTRHVVTKSQPFPSIDNSLSPGISPRSQTKHVVNKSQLNQSIDNPLSPGISHRAQTRPIKKSQPVPTVNNVEEKVSVPDDMTSEGVQDVVESPSHDKELTEVCEPCVSTNGVDDEHDSVILNGFIKDQSSEGLEPDFAHENELSSSGSSIEPSLACKTEELEISPGDRTGKPSPISILEPFFSDDDVSPARTVSRPVESTVQPLCIQFDETEDQQIRITDSGDTEESAFEYVEAVLLSSDLNWSEFEKRWISSLEILDPSLFDEVETFSSRAKYDQRLLFDSTNESLQEVCDRFIPESSFIKNNIWPIPKGMDLINEVWSRLESRLCKVYPRDLDKLIRNELDMSKMWLDLRSESRQIVIEIEELIFKDTVDDTVLCLLDDRTYDDLSCSR
ncbi:TRM32-like protein [Tanacetum coccineum]